MALGAAGGGAGDLPPAPADAPRCGNCRQAMRPMPLQSHYGATVELDVCESCDLIWFDGTETAQLNGPSLLALIGEMARSHALPHEPLRADPRCVRCDGKLALVYNQSRWGRSSQLQCQRRHGAFQSFAQFLHEKGLTRAMSRVDRARLLQTRGRIDCVNCGGAVEVGDETCRWCRSVPSLLDVARLARALDPHDLIEPHPVHATPGRQAALQCAACGVALPPGETIACAQCGAILAITELGDANAAVQALAPALRAAAEKPSPKVVARRLQALDADLPRRREFVAGLEAEARARRGHGSDGDGEPFGWGSLFRRGTSPVRAVAIGIVIWLVWRAWR